MNISVIQQKSGSRYELEPLFCLGDPVYATQSEFGFVGLKDFSDFRQILIQKIHKSNESKFRLSRIDKIAQTFTSKFPSQSPFSEFQKCLHKFG